MLHGLGGFEVGSTASAGVLNSIGQNLPSRQRLPFDASDVLRWGMRAAERLIRALSS